MLRLPRITVEVPVLGVGAGPADYEQLAAYADGLRRPQSLHMTLLHVGILEDFAADVADWTKGGTDPAVAAIKLPTGCARCQCWRAFPELRTD